MQGIARVLASFVLPSVAFSITQTSGAAVTVVREEAYTQPDTRELVLHSQSLERDFVVLVSAPSGPFVEAGKKLPAIYALDGGFGIAGPIGQVMSWSGSMAPAYVVSLSYPPGDQHRNHDLLHRPVSTDGVNIGGGGEAFAKFVIRELRPFLESRFPLDPDNAILLGHSLGGLFTANVLANSPESFAGFVIASPSTGADPNITSAMQAVADRGRGRRVFIAAGQYESSIVGNADRMAKALSGGTSTFDVVNVVYADATHVSYWPDLVPAAFRHVLPAANKSPTKRVAVTLEKGQLDRIAGAYSIGDGRMLAISLRGSRVYATLAGTPETEILAESPQKFFSPVDGFDVTFTFEGSDTAPAQAVVVSLNGAKTRAVRASR